MLAQAWPRPAFMLTPFIGVREVALAACLHVPRVTELPLSPQEALECTGAVVLVLVTPALFDVGALFASLSGASRIHAWFTHAAHRAAVESRVGRRATIEYSVVDEARLAADFPRAARLLQIGACADNALFFLGIAHDARAAPNVVHERIARWIGVAGDARTDADIVAAGTIHATAYRALVWDAMQHGSACVARPGLVLRVMVTMSTASLVDAVLLRYVIGPVLLADDAGRAIATVQYNLAAGNTTVTFFAMRAGQHDLSFALREPWNATAHDDDCTLVAILDGLPAIGQIMDAMSHA